MNATPLNPLRFPISGALARCETVGALGFATFEQLAEYVRLLPYGRPANREDPCAPLREGCGTCSSKHRLLAMVAQNCGRPEIQLMVGIFQMCEANTPGVGAVLNAASITSIPEAHCYLEVQGERFDFTGLAPGNASPFETLSTEQVVASSALIEFKTRFHKAAIAAWASAHGLTPEAAWSIREDCISALAQRLPAKPVHHQIEAG